MELRMEQTTKPTCPCCGRCYRQMCRCDYANEAIRNAERKEAVANELIKEEKTRVRMAAGILLELKNANKKSRIYGYLNTAYNMLHCLELIIKKKGGAL